MSPTGLSVDDANAVWGVLVELAGAGEADRHAFVRYLTDDTAFPHEWRFCGLLGFGGKLHTNHYPAVSVSCYREGPR